jgi:hypothetical protein
MNTIAEQIYVIERLSSDPVETSQLLDKVIYFLTEKDRKKLAGFREKLAALEQQYGMNTAEFQQRFNSGELGDAPQWFDWDGYAALAASLEAKLAATEAGRGLRR